MPSHLAHEADPKSHENLHLFVFPREEPAAAKNPPFSFSSFSPSLNPFARFANAPNGHQVVSFETMIQHLRVQLLKIPRKIHHPPVSERDWYLELSLEILTPKVNPALFDHRLRNCTKIWEVIRKSTWLRDYTKMLAENITANIT